MTDKQKLKVVGGRQRSMINRGDSWTLQNLHSLCFREGEQQSDKCWQTNYCKEPSIRTRLAEMYSAVSASWKESVVYFAGKVKLSGSFKRQQRAILVKLNITSPSEMPRLSR